MSARRVLADQIDALDAEIEALQKDKRELFTAYREANGRAECKAAQAAIRKRQKVVAGKGDEIDEHDALVDEIFCEITSGAPVATRARAARHEAPAKSAPAHPAVSEGKGQRKDASDEAPAGAVAKAASLQGQSEETAAAGRDEAIAVAPAPVVASHFEEPEMPAFLDRRNWVDGKPPGFAAH